MIDKTTLALSQVQDLNVTELTTTSILTTTADSDNITNFSEDTYEGDDSSIDFCDDPHSNHAMNIALELFHASRSILEVNEVYEGSRDYGVMFAALMATATSIRRDIFDQDDIYLEE